MRPQLTAEQMAVATKLIARLCAGTTTQICEKRALWVGTYYALIATKGARWSDNGGQHYGKARIDLVELDYETWSCQTWTEFHEGRYTPKQVVEMIERAKQADAALPAKREAERVARAKVEQEKKGAMALVSEAVERAIAAVEHLHISCSSEACYIDNIKRAEGQVTTTFKGGITVQAKFQCNVGEVDSVREMVSASVVDRPFQAVCAALVYSNMIGGAPTGTGHSGAHFARPWREGTEDTAMERRDKRMIAHVEKMAKTTVTVQEKITLQNLLTIMIETTREPLVAAAIKHVDALPLECAYFVMIAGVNQHGVTFVKRQDVHEWITKHCQELVFI